MAACGKEAFVQSAVLSGDGALRRIRPGIQYTGEVRASPGLMGRDFSGSCTVTSRNSLIHEGATTATKSECFDAEGVPPCSRRVLTAASEQLLATVNFAEFLF